MLWYLGPSVEEISEKQVIVKIPLKRKSSNHFGAMYFGSLAAGADCAGALMAMEKIMEQSSVDITLTFSSFHADFKKRAEGDTFFICDQGIEISRFVHRVALSSERMEMPVEIRAVTRLEGVELEVALFTLGLSLKAFPKKKR